MGSGTKLAGDEFIVVKVIIGKIETIRAFVLLP